MVKMNEIEKAERLKQIKEILSKPTVTYEAGDGTFQQESSLSLRQIEETAEEIYQLFQQMKKVGL